jgi:hypothetical protein
MIPIFFPATWIPQPDRGLLLACFQQVTLLQPALELVPVALRLLQKSGRLNILLPDENTDEGAAPSLPNLLKAHHAWADLHQGEPPDFRKFAQLLPPDADDISTARIRDQIRNDQGETERDQESAPGPDPLLTARLFLAIDQDYQQQRESLSRDLDHIGAMEKSLFQDLSPDQPSTQFAPSGNPSRTRFETERLIPPERRLSAWRQLFAHCPEPALIPKRLHRPFS